MKKIGILTSLICVTGVHASQVATTVQVQTTLAVCVSGQRVEEATLLRNCDLDQSKKIDSLQKTSLPKPKKQGKVFLFAAPLPVEEIVEPLAPAHKNKPVLPVAIVVKELQQKSEEETKKQEEIGQKQ